jgi:hypothetical protein
MRMSSSPGRPLACTSFVGGSASLHGEGAIHEMPFRGTGRPEFPRDFDVGECRFRGSTLARQWAMRSRSLLFFCVPMLAGAVACSAPAADDGAAGGDDAITSKDGKILDFEFEGEVIAPAETDARKAIVSQLMYAQGILTTARNGNGHVGQVSLADVQETAAGANKKITYKATMPVAWPKDIDSPSRYDLPLPKDATAFDRFNAKYDGKCGHNEYGQENFWHDWNPKAEGCTIADADVTRSKATVKPSTLATTNKYPEYDQIWADDRLEVVAIFGIIESNTPSDYGYGEAARFLDHAKSKLTGARVVDNAPSASILKDQTLTGKVTVDGRARDVKIDLVVVQELKSVGADFDTRYDPISEKADLIMYNGHAGLGQNVNALARKGKVAAGKYQLVLLNGCQTFAYMDDTITNRRIEANGAANDPNGTRYLDMIGNALPGWTNNLANMSNDIFDAVLGGGPRKSYSDILATMPESHIVVVFGEEDNRFTP